MGAGGDAPGERKAPPGKLVDYSPPQRSKQWRSAQTEHVLHIEQTARLAAQETRGT
jgi:hypothetical protein